MSSIRLKAILDQIDIPEVAYEKAADRYQNLGEFFSSSSASCAKFSPHIYPQGSFRLGTTIRPIHADAEYDLDVGCRLRAGITKGAYTQEQLKELVGDDLNAYRRARGILERLEEKRRCWRLSYQDQLGFHMDVVPSIPEQEQRRAVIREAVLAATRDAELAQKVANHAGAITDNTRPNYGSLSPDWHISNSEGYAVWFESRINRGRYLAERTDMLKKAKVDELPTWRRKSPLQEAVKLLKRHRDHMYRDNPELAPISVIITTLAAQAYEGEADVASAVENILKKLPNLVNGVAPRVPNPVNPAEDFADKWGEDPELDLEGSFFQWALKASRDFAALRLAETGADVRTTAVQLGAVLSEEAGNALARTSTVFRGPTIITGKPPQPWAK